MSDNKNLEIYKLHAEMADRVTQRRLQTNRFYISLLTGLIALLSLRNFSELFWRI